MPKYWQVMAVTSRGVCYALYGIMEVAVRGEGNFIKSEKTAISFKICPLNWQCREIFYPDF